MAATGNEAVTLKQLKEMRDDISNEGGVAPYTFNGASLVGGLV